MLMSMKDLEIYAATIYGEARGESLEGKIGVGWVIRRRTQRPMWPDTISAVCLQPRQFSCWNDADPNRLDVHLVDVSSPAYRDCLYVAIGILVEKLNDPTGGADHYHSTHIPSPSWAATLTPTITIGGHVFYNSQL